MQTCFFVEKGCWGQYYLDDNGKEHTIQFAPEKLVDFRIATVYFSAGLNILSRPLKHQSIDDWADPHFKSGQKDGGFHEFNHRLLHNHQAIAKRIRLLRVPGEERYLDFTATYPDLMLRLPQTMVASYLGIAPESLSRGESLWPKKPATFFLT